MQTAFEVKLCEACNVNPVRSAKAKKCETCAIALKRVEGTLAVYRHRIRAANGRAKHNATYKGAPTKYVIAQAIEILTKSGKLR